MLEHDANAMVFLCNCHVRRTSIEIRAQNTISDTRLAIVEKYHRATGLVIGCIYPVSILVRRIIATIEVIHWESNRLGGWYC